MGRPNLMGRIKLSEATLHDYQDIAHFRRSLGAARIAVYYPGHISMDPFLRRGRPTGKT